MDTEWCLACDRQTAEPSGYCSDMCRREAHSARPSPYVLSPQDTVAEDLDETLFHEEPIIIHQVHDSSSFAAVAEWASKIPSGVSAGAPTETEYNAAGRLPHPPPKLIRPKPPTLAMSTLQTAPQTTFFRSQPISAPSSPAETTSSSGLNSPSDSVLGTPYSSVAKHQMLSALRSWVPSSSTKVRQQQPCSVQPTFTILCKSPHTKAMRIVPVKVAPPSWSSSSDGDDLDDHHDHYAPHWWDTYRTGRARAH